MAVEKLVLVVSPTPSVAQATASAVRRGGYTPLVVRSFGEAKKHLNAPPHLLITELKLGEYNGIHLALRAQLVETPAIVLADASFEQEVERHGAVWASQAMIETGELEALLTSILQGVAHIDAAYPWYDAERPQSGEEFPTWLTRPSNIPH